MKSLELVCLGPPGARVDGGPPPPGVLWRKHFALLVHLALSPHLRRHRAWLQELLWPDRPEGQARHSLNEAIRRLRRGLGAARLLTEGDQLALNPKGLSVDAWRVPELEAPPGRLLEGFSLGDAPGFEHWLDGERARLGVLHSDSLLRRAELLLRASRLAEASALARELLADDPRRESAVALLMRAAALQGDPPAALEAYRDLSARLALEGEHPTAATAALADRIRCGESTRGPGLREPEAPLVGREAIGAELFGPAAPPGAGPALFGVIGGPGLGKSRLLAECGRRLGLEGWLVRSSRALEADRAAEWSTLRGLLRDDPSRLPGGAGADPWALATLAALCPGLAERYPPAPLLDRAQVGRAMASLWSAVAEEAPLVLLVDDAHWADSASLAALRGALEQCSGPIRVVLASAESGEEHPAELVALHAAAGRSLAGSLLPLRPLTLEDVRQLTGAMAPWCASPEEQRRLARRVHHDTGGDPLLAITMLHGLRDIARLRPAALEWPPPQQTLDSPLPMSIPPLVRVSIVGRVGQLDPGAREVLCAASTTGTEIDPEAVSRMTGLSLPEVESALGLLERRGFLLSDDTGVRFAAPLLTEVVRLGCLTRAQERAYRARAHGAGAHESAESTRTPPRVSAAEAGPRSPGQ